MEQQAPTAQAAKRRVWPWILLAIATAILWRPCSRLLEQGVRFRASGGSCGVRISYTGADGESRQIAADAYFESDEVRHATGTRISFSVSSQYGCASPIPVRCSITQGFTTLDERAGEDAVLCTATAR